ncbi:MAG: YdeI/OmpD-associated family protein [Acidobacteria bacterium]|nr:YdeI/OmpD-associated family protein [Acidobacteriota bacterium]
MGKPDARVDAYIAKAAPFAKPILEYIREVVHGACPDVEETMKWSFPNFEYRGMLCSMASFKAHCAFGFRKGALLIEKSPKVDEAMGQMGRITAIADLPPKKELVRLIKAAMKLNDAGVPAPKAKRESKTPLAIPPDLEAALKKNARARKTFEGFPPSHRREYVEWIVEAKREATRQRRLAQAIEWMADGKSRNWRYEPSAGIQSSRSRQQVADRATFTVASRNR